MAGVIRGWAEGAIPRIGVNVGGTQVTWVDTELGCSASMHRVTCCGTEELHKSRCGVHLAPEGPSETCVSSSLHCRALSTSSTRARGRDEARSLLGPSGLYAAEVIGDGEVGQMAVGGKLKADS